MKGGGVFASVNSTILIRDTAFVNNSAGSGGGLLVAGDAAVGIYNSTFTLNSATAQSLTNVAFVGGGGAAAATAATLTITDCAFSSNTATLGAGVVAVNAATLIINGSSVFSRNNASQDGGGVCVLGDAVLALSPSTQVVDNVAGGWGGGVSLVNGNFAAGDVLAAAGHNNTAKLGDNRVGVAVKQLTLVSSPFVDGYVSRGVTSNSGNYSSLLAELRVSGHHDLPCEGVSVRAMLEGTDFLGVNRSGSRGDVLLDLKVTRPPGVYSIVFSLTEDPNIAPATLHLEVRSCTRGEVTPRPDTCEVCNEASLSINPNNTSCDVCPEGAVCPGGAHILAQPGYWHSAPESLQMHRCPNPQACQGNTLSFLTEQCGATASTGCNSGATGSSYSSQQCGRGYQGNLCGVCAAGFGSLKPFTCTACSQPSVTIGLYVAAAVVLLAFMKLLCHLNMTGSRSAAGQPNMQSPADLLKPLVLYMQYMLIIAGINIQLPEPLVLPLKVLSWLWASAAAPESLGIECAFQDSDMPLPIRRVVFYLCMPLAMLAALLCVEGVIIMGMARRGRRSSAAVSTSGRLAGSAMVVLFFFLPSVTRTIFGLFTCVPLDHDVLPPYVAAAVGRFWVHDMNQPCFEGYHRAWALGLGLPLVIVVCLVLPACIAMLTVLNRHRLTSPLFMQHYGFIYRAYKPSCCYWECVVAYETLLLVAVRVFGWTLGPFYQGLALNVVVALILITLLVVRPYAQQQTARVAVHGTGCLLLTSYAVLSFVRCGGVAAGREYVLALGAVTVVVNLLYVCSVVWQLLKHMIQ